MQLVHEALQDATNGLLFSSETDAPFEIISWNVPESSIGAETIQSIAAIDPNTPIEEIRFEDFFKNLVQEEEWHDEKEQTIVQQYRRLKGVLENSMTDLHVFRVGETEIDIIVVGRVDNKTVAGVKTKAVET